MALAWTETQLPKTDQWRLRAACRSVDPDRPLFGYGLDSLGVLELRTRIETETGIRISSTDITTITIRGLAELLCEKLAPAEAA